MSISELGSIGEFLGSIVVMITLVYLAVQVRQNTAQQKREETVLIQHGQNEIVSQMQDPSLVRAYALTAEGYDLATVEDRSRATMWVIQYLNNFQIVYDLHQSGTLGEERYKLWEGWAISIVASKGIQEWWDDGRGKLGFSQEVRDLIDQKLNDTAVPPVPLNELWTIFAAESWERVDTQTDV